MYIITKIVGKRPARKCYFSGQKPISPRSKRQSTPSTIWSSHDGDAILFPTEKGARQTMEAMGHGGDVERLPADTPRAVALWEGVNAYVRACGGDDTVANGARMDAVVAISAAVGL